MTVCSLAMCVRGSPKYYDELGPDAHALSQKTMHTDVRPMQLLFVYWQYYFRAFTSCHNHARVPRGTPHPRWILIVSSPQ